MSYVRFVPVKPRRKPILGNLALAGALVLVNSIRAACFLVFWALNR